MRLTRTEVLLIRHGETPWNKLGKLQGNFDIDLSSDGVIQAEYLAQKLGGKFDCIYSSPMICAKETAEIISKGTGKSINTINDLRDIHFGDWEGLTKAEIFNNYKTQYINWKTTGIGKTINNRNLNLKIACKRAKTAILSLIKMHEHERIVIVAHKGIIKAGLIGLLKWDLNMYNKIILLNTSICQLSFNESLNPSVFAFNDNSQFKIEFNKSYLYRN